MQIVSFPPALVDKLLDGFAGQLATGSVAEGVYFKEKAEEFVMGRTSVPVTSGGAAIFALLAHYKHVHGKTHVVVQSNTMRALYTVPRLLDLEVVVADSTYGDFLAMNPDSLAQVMREGDLTRNSVVLYSVIGGYLAPSFTAIHAYCQEHDIPLVVDGAHAHYLPTIEQAAHADVAYSFYATKILPSGEGGLISTSNEEVFEWVRRFLIYDRFHNEFEVGLNLRPSELGAYFIHTLMTDPTLRTHYRDDRVAIANHFKAICQKHGLRFLDPAQAADFNGYKFVMLDPLARVEKLGTDLTRFPVTSPVFATNVLGQPTDLPHWCPPTYSSLRGEFFAAAAAAA